MKLWYILESGDVVVDQEDDALIAIADVDRDEAVLVAALLVRWLCRMSIEPCSVDSVGVAFSAYMSTRYNFSWPGWNANSPTIGVCVTVLYLAGFLVVINEKGLLPPTKSVNSPTIWLHVTACFRSSRRDYWMRTIAADRVRRWAAAVWGFAVCYVLRDSVKTVLKLTLRAIRNTSNVILCSSCVLKVVLVSPRVW